MVIVHPCGYIRETIRDLRRDSGVVRRERQIQLGIICIAVIWKTMRADDRAQRGGVHGKEKWSHHQALGQPCGEAVRYRQLTLPWHVEQGPSEVRFKIRPYLTQYATQLQVQTLVISRLDFYNAVLTGLPACVVKPLFLRLLLGTSNKPALDDHSVLEGKYLTREFKMLLGPSPLRSLYIRRWTLKSILKCYWKPVQSDSNWTNVLSSWLIAKLQSFEWAGLPVFFPGRPVRIALQ